VSREKSAMQGDVRKKMDLTGKSGLFGWLGTVLSAGSFSVFVYRFGAWGKNKRFPLIAIPAKLIYFPLFYLVQVFTGISVQAYANIGKRFVVLNHSCIFVVAEKIGDDFTVSQGVTVGNVRGKKRLPVIGNNVYLEPGCKVLGELTIGDNVVVRANSLVLNDVPSNSIVAGNPARIQPRPAEQTAA
jgi:serine O-acetyltransferase